MTQQLSSDVQATVAGRVLILYGTVKAIDTNGSERMLHPGDPVYLGDRIVTGPDATVSVVIQDGDQDLLELGSMSETVIDSDLVGSGGRDGGHVSDMDVGHDGGESDVSAPSDGAMPPVENDGGGHPFVAFAATGLEVTPDSGAETIGIERDFLDPPRPDMPIEIEEKIIEPDELLVPSPTISAGQPVADQQVQPTSIASFPEPKPPNQSGGGGSKPDNGISATVEEEALDNAWSAGNQELDDDGDPTTSDDDDGADVFSVQGSLGDVVGDDGATFGFAADAVTTMQSLGLTSRGESLQYTLSSDGSTLFATVPLASGDDRTVFTLELDGLASGDDYHFTLSDQLDHETGDGENSLAIDFSEAVTATDSSGHTSSLADFVSSGGTAFSVNVIDDVPEVHQIGFQVFFDFEHANYDNILGVYELNEAGEPINPHIIVNSTDLFQDHDGDELVYSSTSGADGIFLIQNGAGNIDKATGDPELGRDILDSEIRFEFHPDSDDGYYTLQYFDGTAWQDYDDDSYYSNRIFFMDTNLNQTVDGTDEPDHFADISTERSDGDYEGEDLNAGEYTITSVPISPDSDPSHVHYIGAEDIWGGSADWDYNDATVFAVAGLGVRESALSGSTGAFNPNVNEQNSQVAGNLLDDGNILPGADEEVTLTVDGQTLSLDGEGSDIINILSHDSYGGLLGSLTIRDDGEWAYQLLNPSPDHTVADDPTTGDGLEFDDVVQDVFNITVSDYDGDTAVLPLTIHIYDGEDVDTGPAIGANVLAAAEGGIEPGALPAAAVIEDPAAEGAEGLQPAGADDGEENTAVAENTDDGVLAAQSDDSAVAADNGEGVIAAESGSATGDENLPAEAADSQEQESIEPNEQSPDGTADGENNVVAAPDDALAPGGDDSSGAFAVAEIETDFVPVSDDQDVDNLVPPPEPVI